MTILLNVGRLIQHARLNWLIKCLLDALPCWSLHVYSWFFLIVQNDWYEWEKWYIISYHQIVSQMFLFFFSWRIEFWVFEFSILCFYPCVFLNTLSSVFKILDFGRKLKWNFTSWPPIFLKLDKGDGGMNWSIFCTLQGIRNVNSAFHKEVTSFVYYLLLFFSHFHQSYLNHLFVLCFPFTLWFLCTGLTTPLYISTTVVCLSVCLCW